MKKSKTCKFISLLLAAIITLGSTQAFAWANEIQVELPLQPVYEAYSDGAMVFETEALATEPYLRGNYDHAYSILTSTLNSSVGMQGFEGSYAISCPDAIVEIIVQFMTPPSVALRLMDERAISPQRTGSELSDISFEEQALYAHDVFNQQLNSISVPFGRSMNITETFSEHHTLFNGVFIRVPGYMVSMIAALPEVFAVIPNVAYYALEEFEQLTSHPQNGILPYDNFHMASLTNTESQGSPFFVNPNFMRSVREYLELDYIHCQEYGMGITGAGVRVAVLDSGIDHIHQEFDRFLDDAGRIRGWEHNCNSPVGVHGTVVSGAVIGVAPGIELWNYLVFGPVVGGTGIHMNLVFAAIEAAHEEGIDIINMSIQTPHPTQYNPFHPLGQVVNLAVLDGIVMVASAGNTGRGNYVTTNPANASLSIAVGAGSRGSAFPYMNPYAGLDRLRRYSSSGPIRYVHHIKPDIIAPSGVVTTHSGRANYTCGGCHIWDCPTWRDSTGTSLAAPIIAGIAALLLEQFPGATPIEIKAKMMNTARPLMDRYLGDGYEIYSVFEVGAGFVQPLQALTTETVVTTRHNIPNVPIWANPAEMASLSFGLLNLHYDIDMNKTLPVSISNTGDSSVAYTISYMFTRNNGGAASINLGTTHITVAPGSTGELDIALLIASNANTGFYEGYIYVSNGIAVVARLPFGAVVNNEPTSTPVPQILRVYNEQQFRDALSQLYLTPLVIEIALDFTIMSPFITPVIPIGTNAIIRGANGHTRTIRTTHSNNVFSIGGNLTLENIRIISDSQRIGNGFEVYAGGHLTILNGTVISGNRGTGVALVGGNLIMYGGEISNNTSTNGGGISISIDDLRNGMLQIGPDAMFLNNTALTAHNRLPIDNTVYNTFINTTNWSQPFTQGFNNFDIQYTLGAQLPMQQLSFHLNGTPAIPTNPQHIAPLGALPGARIMSTFNFPADPMQLEYRFGGWYLDSNFTERVMPETPMQGFDKNLYARWRPLYVIFNFDNRAIQLPVVNGFIDTSKVPTPATRYGRPHQPGSVHMGWFTELFPGMHWFGLGANRATTFDLTQRITPEMTDPYGHLHLHAGFLRYGDINGDGWIDMMDRSMMQNFMLGIVHEIHRVTADMNVDGIIDPIDRTLLQNHILGAPGVILGIPHPDYATRSYIITYNFGGQAIDIPIAGGRIDTTRITEEELLIWEMELLNFLYTTSGRSGRTAGLFVYVNELHSGKSYMLELDTFAFGTDTYTLALEISALDTTQITHL